MDGQTLEGDVGNLACSRAEEENEEGREGGHDHDHSMVAADHRIQGGRVGDADNVLEGMAAVWVPPPANVTKQYSVRGRWYSQD